MATTYPTETLNWANQPQGNLTNKTTPMNTGETTIDVKVTSTAPSSTYVTNTAATGRGVRAQAANGQTSTTEFTFRDNASAPGTVNTGENLAFRISDIDGRGNDRTGDHDVVTVRAYDQNNNPMWVEYTTPVDPTYIVKRNDDGSITITAKRGTNESALNPKKIIDIAIAGPVDRLVVSHTNVGNTTGSFVRYGNIGFTPSSAICFAAGTLIRTPAGDVAVETLKVGDLVMTRDNGAQPVRWIDSTRRALRAGSRLAPVRIRAGALGDNLPESDLLVSPQHRMLVRSAIAQRMFGTDEVLVAAKQLLQIDGIDIADDLDEVVYVHFIFSRHEIVYANGAESESLYTGPEALKTLSPRARKEILALFPELAEDALPEPARVLASGRLGRKLAVRHAQNDKPLV